MRDFIVIGGGPSGSYCAQALSKKGYNTLQLEEHKTVGKPVECTGLVSRRVTKMVKTDSIVNRVHGANVFFPNGESISIGKEEETIVLERDRFDQDVAGASIDSGTELLLNSRVRDIKISDHCAEVVFRRNGEIVTERSLAVVGADGANSITRKLLYPEQRFKRVVSAYQIDGAKRLDDQDKVNVFLGSKYSKGYFGWNTPAGDFSRIGTAGFGMSREKFEVLYKKYLEPNKITVTGGPIPISFLERPFGNRSLLVGDAAGIVKPLSGGGIYTGMVSGEMAAEALDKAYENENFGENFLKMYDKLWKNVLGRELKRDFRIQKMYARITDYSFNKIGKAVTSNNMRNLISTIGAIDYPSEVVLSIMFRKPSILWNVLFPRKDPDER